ncbi:MAG: AAA family ATPase [Acidobacteriia bacterium]|nr:AAA family ATPase [Terriglobia bacterium]
MPLLGEEQWLFTPPVPRDMESLGLSSGLVMDLVLRRLSVESTGTIQSLSHFLKLPVPIVHAVFTNLRQQQLVEVKGMVGNDYRISLSGAGRSLVAERMQVSQYSGAAPVSLKAYSEAVKLQATEVEVSRSTLQAAFSDLVVPDSLLDQLGPALIEQSSIFLYGPPGNGKSSLAERLLRVFQDSVFIPYAVEVDGQIISLYDPAMHQRVAEDSDDRDPRWVPCRRPCIIAGGELTMGLLDLRYDDTSGVYSAPLQMKANNGVFVIDDFGRQLVSPRELLNRWIVPLDRRVDYLSLKYGLKFEIPFQVLVVFATNLKPSELADEAFLRRIHNKIRVDAVSADAFDEIFRRVARARKVKTTPESFSELRRLVLADGRSELRACYPVDVCNILNSIANYENCEATASLLDLKRAVELYFTME